MNIKMEIKNAQYMADENGNNVTIRATINGSLSDVPINDGNRHYIEIMKQVKEGNLTIKDA
tara:strand:+ start:198 stop:380 length:183 start_codon:yes stop_codon:yes gene_type:complete